jgi:hypothetical protein
MHKRQLIKKLIVNFVHVHLQMIKGPKLRLKDIWLRLTRNSLWELNKNWLICASGPPNLKNRLICARKLKKLC